MVFLPTLILPAITALVLSAQAAPLKDAPDTSQGLVQRDNIYHLKCGNAPTVVAGNFLHPSDLPAPAYNHRLDTPPPLSGTNEPFMDYLWCTPNTTTYTFFGVGTVDPQPSEWYNTKGALLQAVASLQFLLAHNSDSPLTGGQWSISPPTTEIDIYVQNSKGTMTYGVLLSAMEGLSRVAELYIHEKKTMVFQINDGKWGELGIGYVGFAYQGAKGNCAYDIVGNDTMPCEDVRQGLVIKS